MNRYAIFKTHWILPYELPVIIELLQLSTVLHKFVFLRLVSLWNSFDCHIKDEISKPFFFKFNINSVIAPVVIFKIFSLHVQGCILLKDLFCFGFFFVIYYMVSDIFIFCILDSWCCKNVVQHLSRLYTS